MFGAWEGVVFRRWTSNKNTKAIGGAVLAITLLSGCLGNANNSDTTVEALTSPSDDLPPENQNSTQLDGPLDEFLVQIFGISLHDATPQQLQEMHTIALQEREQFVAACMLEKGFRYSTPAEVRRPLPIRVAPSDEARYGTREWAAQWGFGISTRPPLTAQRTQRQRQTSPFGAFVVAGPENEADMSQAELEAWYLAMYGVTLESMPPHMRTTNEGFPWDDVPQADLGCETRWRIDQMVAPQPFRALHDDINRLDGIVLTDPRTLELDAAWASCMIDAGEGGWSNPRQPFDVLSPLFWQDEVPVEVLVAWDWVAQPDGPPQPDRSQFRARELAVAVADWDCRDQVGYDEALRKIDFDLQQAFINQHQNELEAWVEYANQQRIPATQATSRPG